MDPILVRYQALEDKVCLLYTSKSEKHLGFYIIYHSRDSFNA